MYIFHNITILLYDIIGFIKTERERERERASRFIFFRIQIIKVTLGVSPVFFSFELEY